MEFIHDLKQLDLDRLITDATFIPGKKRGPSIGPTKSGKGSKALLLTDSHGWPLHVMVTSASPHEVNLIEPLLASADALVPRRTRLVYDTAADSGPLRDRLRGRGTWLIAPHRSRRRRGHSSLTKYERRHYAHRWKIERTFAWLKHGRRLTTHWEYHAHLHAGFWHLACLFLILKRL